MMIVMVLKMMMNTKTTSMETTWDRVSHMEGVQMQLCLSGARSTYIAGTIPKRPCVTTFGDQPKQTAFKVTSVMITPESEQDQE